MKGINFAPALQGYDFCLKRIMLPKNTREIAGFNKRQNNFVMTLKKKTLGILKRESRGYER